MNSESRNMLRIWWPIIAGLIAVGVAWGAMTAHEHPQHEVTQIQIKHINDELAEIKANQKTILRALGQRP